MSKTAFIIHGSFGYPNENWFPWLKKELETIGYSVYVPQFPTPENQSLESWNKEFECYTQHINSDSIIFGHSTGVPFVLHILEKYSFNAAYLVAGFCEMTKHNIFDPLNKTFVKFFKWETIKKNCKKFYIFHSDNDPYVPLFYAENLARKLESKPVIIKNAGHFNEKAGYTTFPEILGYV